MKRKVMCRSGIVFSAAGVSNLRQLSICRPDSISTNTMAKWHSLFDSGTLFSKTTFAPATTCSMSNLDASDMNIEVFGSISVLVNVATVIYTQLCTLYCSRCKHKSTLRKKFFIFYTCVHISEMATKLVNFYRILSKTFLCFS